MKAIIIPSEKIRFYKRQFDEFESIEPQELANGEYFLSDNILSFLQSYADNELFPLSVRESARLTKLELESLELREITDADLKTGELPTIADLFPHEGLNIRVDISDTSIRQITKSPYKPLIDLALLAVNEDNTTGVTIWLSHLDNPQMTADQVRGILESFGATITIKDA